MSDRGQGLQSVVARGRIKVDARKALDKLRDHMLVDHHLYACEIGRVAVSLGGTTLDVEHDADDVTFTFVAARVPDANAIARVRDHVLAPPEGGDGDALRNVANLERDIDALTCVDVDREGFRDGVAEAGGRRAQFVAAHMHVGKLVVTFAVAGGCHAAAGGGVDQRDLAAGDGRARGVAHKAENGGSLKLRQAKRRAE